MKFVVYGAERQLGLVEGARVLNLPRTSVRFAAHQRWADLPASAVLSSLGSLVDAGARGLDLVREVAERARGSDDPDLFEDLSAVTLHAPWPGKRLVLAGANNARHVAECFTNMGSPLTAHEFYEKARRGPPSAFWGVAQPVMGPQARIQIPARANGLFDYEGEPAVVLGARGKDIKATDMSSYIWGVTLLVDWSIRDGKWPPLPADPLMFAKNFDCSKSIGPCVVAGEVDPHSLQIQTLVNGKVRQDFNSSEMIFTFGEILEYLSQDFTFFPGDMLAGGTGAGTAIDKTVPNQDGSWPRELFLKSGDVVEVRSPAIGSLVGRVVPKS